MMPMPPPLLSVTTFMLSVVSMTADTGEVGTGGCDTTGVVLAGGRSGSEGGGVESGRQSGDSGGGSAIGGAIGASNRILSKVTTASIAMPSPNVALTFAELLLTSLIMTYVEEARATSVESSRTVALTEPPTSVHPISHLCVPVMLANMSVIQSPGKVSSVP